MKSPIFSFQWLVMMIFSISAAATKLNNVQRLRLKRVRDPDQESASASTLSHDYKTFYYKQTLDHFNYRDESSKTFKQKYVINFKYWGGAKAKAPIFVLLGAEMALDADQITSAGFLADNAGRFKALLVYLEHRYFGESVPKNLKANNIADFAGYFNSDQALADYAEILLYIKRKYNATYSPVIVFGGSYGGMLAAWFRLKLPHIAVGALASSAPILFFEDIVPKGAYFRVVTKDFREVSETCYQTIRQSWSEINKFASQPNGLSVLSKKFKTCKPLQHPDELKQYLINSVYAQSAQYNAPPVYPVSKVCSAIDRAPLGTDILSKIFAGFVAAEGNNSCYINQPEDSSADDLDLGWNWLTCSEIVMPQPTIVDNTMFESNNVDLNAISKDCKTSLGVTPRLHWVPTYYGTHDIKLALRRFGSNIIFSNGLVDPYSVGGVLENISETIVAVYTEKGSHCLDLLPSNSKTDPKWLVNQRETEVKIIQGWITQYHADLKALNLN